MRCDCTECDDDLEIKACVGALIRDVVIGFEVHAHGENEQCIVASARQTIALLPCLQRVAGPQCVFVGLGRPNPRQSSSHAANTLSRFYRERRCAPTGMAYNVNTDTLERDRSTIIVISAVLTDVHRVQLLDATFDAQIHGVPVLRSDFVRVTGVVVPDNTADCVGSLKGTATAHLQSHQFHCWSSNCAQLQWLLRLFELLRTATGGGVELATSSRDVKHHSSRYGCPSHIRIGSGGQSEHRDQNMRMSERQLSHPHALVPEEITNTHLPVCHGKVEAWRKQNARLCLVAADEAGASSYFFRPTPEAANSGL